MNKFAKALFLFTIAIIITLAKPFIVIDLYEWHVMNQFQLPVITYAQTFGILILLQVISGFRSVAKDAKYKLDTHIYGSVFGYGFLWFLGWLLS